MNYIPVLRSPHYAVDGFMVLSGLLMAYHYALRSNKEPWTQPSTWTSFYIRRYFRLSPVYYLLLIPAFVFRSQYDHWKAAIHTLFEGSQQVPASPAITLGNIVFHLSYLFGLSPTYHASIVLPDWSLSLEMQFYLVFPFLMLFALRFGWTAFSLVGAGFWLIGTSSVVGLASQFVQPSALILSLLWFIVGMLWASALLETDKSTARNRVLLACGLSLLSRDPHDIILVFVFAWLIFGSERMLLGGALTYLRRVLSNRFSSFLADASYSVYLMHLLILTPIAYFLGTSSHLGAIPRFIIAASLTLAVSYGIAVPLEVLENAGIALGKRLTRKQPALNHSAQATVEIPA